MTQALAFWRLKEAEEALRDDKHPIFSFQVSINGGRKFRAFTKEELWKFYETLDTRYYYEVLRPNNSCKVYFDLEYEAGQNEEVLEGHSGFKEVGSGLKAALVGLIGCRAGLQAFDLAGLARSVRDVV